MADIIYYECDPWEKERREFRAGPQFALYKRLVRFLASKSNPERKYFSRTLEVAMGLKAAHGVKIRTMIRIARRCGHPIAGSTSAGYWYEPDYLEICDVADKAIQRAKDQLFTWSKVKKLSRTKYQVQTNAFSGYNRKMAAAK